MRVAGLVLAAGGGTRLGRPKAVVAVGGQRLVDRSVSVLSAGGAEPVFVVVGAVPVGHVEAFVVCNDDWRTGMASSLRAGLAALDEYAGSVADVDAVVLSLVDLVDLSPDAVRAVVDAASAGARAVTATYGGDRGHPVLLRRADWPAAAAAAHGDAGARRFLSDPAHEVVEVACDGFGNAADIDTTEDLAAARKRHAVSRPHPTGRRRRRDEGR